MTSPKIIAGGTAIALLLSACGPAYAPGGPRANQGTGTAIGAVLGGAIGALTEGSTSERKNAALGALIGAGVGAAIGHELDKQAAELRQDFGNDQIDVINTGEELIVRMPQDILFDFDSATLRAELQADLAILADNLGRYPNSTITVEGHTDNVGSAAYNLDLSQRRAESVVNILINNGVALGRLFAVGRGEDSPVADNLTDAGRAQNRRVEIIIRPTGEG